MKFKILKIQIKYEKCFINHKSLIIKAISILLLVTIQLTSFPAVSYAQDTSPSAQTESSLSASPSSEVTNTPGINVFENLNADTTGLINLTQNQNSQTSAVFSLPVKVHKLSKRNFRADEKITIIVENTSTDNVKIQLFDVDGNNLAVEMEKVSAQDPAVLRLIPPAQFKAGRYRLVITDSSGNITTQDFTWGVLAINTNKSIYLPNETANIAMAVLDETGLMVCDANVILKIKNQISNIEEELSTDNGKIIVNPDCSVKDYTLKPDYEASYQVQNAGFYDLTLTAKTESGTYSITDGFDVRDNVPFDVERVNATRIFPPVTYSSIFNITANEDFTGTITETVPDSFAILPTDGAKFADNISSESAQVSSGDLIKGEIPNLNLPYQGSFAISQKFGSEIRDPLVAAKYSQFGLAGHDGIDFDLPEGEAVLAADDGEVVRATENGDYGTTIVIQHSWGKSYYGHLSLITAQVGNKYLKGHPIGISGSTGLSSGPHLHFGIKPNKNDFNNGYYGKINPAPYLGLESYQNGNDNIVFSSSQNQSYDVRVLTWNVTLKKGESIKLGYGYKVPNVSPQFYLLGPLQFTDANGEVVFQEQRQWQLAIDADGSGTNTVSPTTGTTSTTGNTYTFTFTAAETMNSGGIKITVPSGWSAPQGTAGTAGYTTAVGNGTATVADVLNDADVEDPTTPAGIWQEIEQDMCGAAATLNAAGDILLDTTTFQETTGSIKCALTTGTAAAADNNDDWGFVYDANQNWNTFCGGAKCTQVGYWIRAAVNTEAFEFDVSSTTDISTGLTGAMCAGSITTANTWEYNTCDISTATLTTVKAFGFSCTNNACNPFDGGDVWVDEFLIGPGVPTFSGTGPWDIDFRILDAANTNTITVTYGSGGGASGVTNSATSGTYTFTTKSRISVSGTLTNISTQPTVCLNCGPTNDQLMRHGGWFNSGVEQPFTF